MGHTVAWDAQEFVHEMLTGLLPGLCGISPRVGLGAPVLATLWDEFPSFCVSVCILRRGLRNQIASSNDEDRLDVPERIGR